MSSVFSVRFSDMRDMSFFDIIIYTQDQKDLLTQIASDFTQKQLRDKDQPGIDIPLVETQKPIIINKKNEVVTGKTAKELKDTYTVLVTVHAIESILIREGSNEESYIINIIQRIIDSDTVTKAQFKGHPRLSYTVCNASDPQHYKTPISFRKVKGGKDTISSITVFHRGAPPKLLTQSFSQDPETKRKMEEFYDKLEAEQKAIERKRSN